MFLGVSEEVQNAGACRCAVSLCRGDEKLSVSWKHTAIVCVEPTAHAGWQPAVTEIDGRSYFAGFLLRHQRIGTR